MASDPTAQGHESWCGQSLGVGCTCEAESAAQGRPWWSYIPVVNVVILWAKYGWEGFE